MSAGLTARAAALPGHTGRGDAVRARLPLRIARAGAFSVVCLGLAALGHHLAGGSGVTAGTVAPGFAVVASAAAVLAGRERPPALVVVALGAAQLFLHGLFTWNAAPAAGLPHRGGLVVDAGMTLGHLTATLITGWWLARGEAALWSLLRIAGARAVRRLRALPASTTASTLPEPPARPPAPDRGPRRPHPGRLLRHAVVRRGPPFLAGS
ncbi:MFS transporter [Thermoactinospora rubra]|uniref:MFS transporter n=1 Tax=Thermoactinospora rubra TaxID=1088767 RepID=UPI0011804E40|nr:MFS transporter [Thermoactinospora rubra]